MNAPELTAINPLPTVSVYEGLDTFKIPTDMQSWVSAKQPIFEALVKKHAPKTIIEVGSHKGVSACHWAHLAGKDCKVYCVDTWLQAAVAVLSPKCNWNMVYQNGHPMTYWTFLQNVKTAGFHEQIVPIVNTSSEGAIILLAHKITAPVIYIDASHEYRSAYQDICDYWPLLESGGSMLVDDLTLYPGVYAACIRFTGENNLWGNFSCVENKMFGLFSKP